MIKKEKEIGLLVMDFKSKKLRKMEAHFKEQPGNKNLLLDKILVLNHIFKDH
jgi:hypothetical protein